MRRILLAAIAATGLIGPVSAASITDAFSSFYVLGDSLSDDGNLFGPAWYVATGGKPYSGSFFGGGTFTNGEVWNEPIQREFRNAGHDADNFAMSGGETTDDNFFLADLPDQIARFGARTSASERGDNPLVSMWFGGNDIFDSLSGGGDVIQAAINAADNLAKGALAMSAPGSRTTS